MENILVTRIDDRLIHGQVVTAWVKFYPINHIIIIDDELSKNKLMERIYKAASPKGIKLTMTTEKDILDYLKNETSEDEGIMILVKVPQVLEKLIDKGIISDKIILGGMGAKIGRKTFKRNVSANEEEVKSFKRILERGVQIVYQMVPQDPQIDIRKILD